MQVKPKILIADQTAIHVINPEEILFCKSSDGYTTIYVISGKKHLLSKSLTKFSEELKSPFFLRVHQSYLINTNYLVQINKKEKIVMLMNDFKVPFTISVKKLIMMLRLPFILPTPSKTNLVSSGWEVLKRNLPFRQY
jgi:two-component system LytT family response regulator